MIPTSRGVIMPRARQYGARCPHREVTPRAIVIMPRAQEKRQGRLHKALYCIVFFLLFCGALTCVALHCLALCCLRGIMLIMICFVTRCYAMLWGCTCKLVLESGWNDICALVFRYVMFCYVLIWFSLLCCVVLCYAMLCCVML